MKLTEHVLRAIEDATEGRFDSALLHACISVDATSRRLFPSESKVRKRYVECLRSYYWILEPMLCAGINLVDTKFSNVQLKATRSPDLAEIVYEIFRCSHAHGDEVPPNYSVIPTEGRFNSKWFLADGQLHMPDRITILVSEMRFSTSEVGGDGRITFDLLPTAATRCESNWRGWIVRGLPAHGPVQTLPRAHELHDWAERHVPQVRHVRGDEDSQIAKMGGGAGPSLFLDLRNATSQPSICCQRAFRYTVQL
jgi:hypothetical protein